jgi:signal transduction histidine kinase
LLRARSRRAVAELVTKAARQLVGADGATFVLRDGNECLCLDEDAIAPLWKGQRLEQDTCISGWVMRHGEQVVLPDVSVDPRVPQAAFRPTFVTSLALTPVRGVEPPAAIGVYWSEHHAATQQELKLLQELADTAAVALENAQVYEELEQRVADRTEQLRHANLELEAFTHTVAHDLRTPLNAIVGFADLLKDAAAPLPDDTVRDFASEISAAGRRLNELIGALLEFTHNAGREVRKQRVDLSAMAHTIIAELVRRDRGLAELIVAPGLESWADPALIEVLLTSLLGNALKYSSKVAAPRIELDSLGTAEGATTFFVRDNGAGFDPSRSARLFMPFQRLHPAYDFPGTGVGLAIVARIVRRHGGRVWAEGKPGLGATFYFSLPTLQS